MMRYAWATVALMSGWLIIAAPAGADPPTPRDRAPQWVRQPTAEDLLAVWPTDAIRQGIGGHVVLQCTVPAQGPLSNCSVRSETPAGMGFGAAALTMSSQFLFRPAIRHGVAVSEQVGIPLDFQQPEAPVGSIMRGQTPLGTPRSVQGVAWTAVPSVADLAAAYPRGARERRVAGVATLSCQIRGDGSLRQCSTVSEEPRSDGFAVAARELSRLFRAPVDQPGNQALEGAYTQIRFNFPVEALDPASQVIGRPTWAQRPHAGIPGSEYPRPAVAAHITEGRVALRCIVGPDGHLTHCTPTSEDPPGYGFAQAATALATGFVMTLWTQDGLPTVGAAVNVPVHYVLPPTAPVPAPPALR